MQVAGGVGRDKFHLHAAALAAVAAAKIRAFGSDLRHHRRQPVRFHAKIKKAGAGDLHPLYRRAAEIDVFGNDARDIARRQMAGAGEQHGDVDGKIAVRFFPWPLDSKIRQRIKSDLARGAGFLQRRQHAGADRLPPPAENRIIFVHEKFTTSDALY